VIKPKQRHIFGFEGTPDEFITQIITDKPSSELREGYIWHIGNVRNIGNNEGFVFAAGRTTKKNKALYDEETKDFLEVDDEESPFTYIYYDRHYGILGIEPKSKLSPTVKGIARNIEKLFNRHIVTKDSGIKIEISEIWDPEDFLKLVRQSYAVVGFTVHFGNPNPFDVEADFHRPMENYLEATGGDKGKATVQGIDLDRDKIEEVTRSVASTGNDASARIRLHQGQRPVTKHLEGDPVVIPIEEEESTDTMNLLSRIRNAYSRIRTQREE
jgi:hypothetical protein